MKVLKYLENKSLYDLHMEYGIRIKEYHDCNLAVLNYSQIDSPKFHPIVRECRGLIIDFVDLKPVSRTFERFFNLNENENDPFVWHHPFRAEEKADGSLISVYWHNKEWRIASRGNAFAEGVTAFGTSFHEIFESIIKKDINDFMKDMFRNRSYTFEMCSLQNKVVKIYEEPVVYLLNVVKVQTGEDLSSIIVDYNAETLGVERPKVYDIGSVDEIHASFKDFEPTEEGYVLIDENGNRIKIKNSGCI